MLHTFLFQKISKHVKQMNCRVPGVCHTVLLIGGGKRLSSFCAYEESLKPTFLGQLKLFCIYYDCILRVGKIKYMYEHCSKIIDICLKLIMKGCPTKIVTVEHSTFADCLKSVPDGRVVWLHLLHFYTLLDNI